MSTAAPAATPAAPTGGAPEPTAPAEAAKEAAPPAPRKYKLKGIDGDKEVEYEESALVGLAKRGKNAAQLVSIAEKKAMEAAKKEQEAEARLARLKDLKQARAVLKELGVDVRKLAEEEILEHVEEEKLTPEQKRTRELERKLREKEEQEERQKTEAQRAAEKAEEEKHLEAFSNLFMDVMERTGLPRESANAVGYRLAAMYQAADAAGVQVEPDLAAERVKGALLAEHKALFTNKDGTLNLEALTQWIGPEGMKQIRKAAVEEYRKTKTAGAAQPKPLPPPAPPQEDRRQRSSFWKEFDKQFR